MVVGFNHNFKYKGVTYHIQTEDGGLGSPNIITLLYHGGTILASRKTSYADIIKTDQLEKVVEDLMKEQHKGMLRSLKDGDFDDVIARYQERSGKKPVAVAQDVTDDPVAAPAPMPAPDAETAPVEKPRPTKPPVAAPSPGKKNRIPPVNGSGPLARAERIAAATRRPSGKSASSEGSPKRPEQPEPKPETANKRPAVEASLDEIVLSYLMGDEK